MNNCVLPEYRYPINAMMFWFPDFFLPKRTYNTTPITIKPIKIGNKAPIPDDSYAAWMIVDVILDNFSPNDAFEVVDYETV